MKIERDESNSKRENESEKVYFSRALFHWELAEYKTSEGRAKGEWR